MKRKCLQCGEDLTDEMGIYVFVTSYDPASRTFEEKNAPGLLCVEHGSNGRNGMTQEEYDRLTT